MPAANDLIAQQPISALVYGPAKSRKTWWALRAAEAGYRVLVFSLEKGHAIVQQIPPEARERIYIIDAADGPTDGFAALTVTTALKEFNFYIEENKRLVSTKPRAGMVHVDLRSFGTDTVVVWDTYSALAVSTARNFAFENGIDLSDAGKPEWEGYGYCGRLLTWMLTQMRALPCHTLVIAHETRYEKYKKDKQNPKRQGPLEFERRQPISSSNPHGMTVARDFDNVLYMYIEGRSTWIDTRGSRLEDAGSRIIPPNRYSWDELSFGDLARAAGHALPAAVEPFNFPIVGGEQPSPTNTPLPSGEQKAARVGGSGGTGRKPSILNLGGR